MIIKSVEIEQFRALKETDLKVGKRLTAIAGRNACMKTTLLGILSQPFSISNDNVMFGEKTIDGYNYRSQFNEKFKISLKHDKPGKHKWKLNFYNKVYNDKDYISIISSPRKSGGKTHNLRFINDEKGKQKGNGYVQVPVVYLSLSRLFPIGEVDNTKEIFIDLSKEEENLYIEWYKKILSIQSVNNPKVSVERKDSKHIFSGINRDEYSIQTESAGEENIGRIILAILSFKRLKEKYNTDYIGGILLLDEVDASLYGFSQTMIISQLKEWANTYNIQIVFTTHSPIVLKEISKLQREEILRKKITKENLNKCDLDFQIISLFPDYKDSGKRFIHGKNIVGSKGLKDVLNDIELKPMGTNQQIHLYVEDKQSIIFLKSIFKFFSIDINAYVDIIDINLGWSNYCHLIQKEIPEFLNSLIVLDQDVKDIEKNEQQEKILNGDNILFLPENVEKGMFNFLKNHKYFNEYKNLLLNDGIMINYDVCFAKWTNDEYDTSEYKKWFHDFCDVIKSPDSLFMYWCKKNKDKCNDFITIFKDKYNLIAKSEELDYFL